ncbi:MAG TPA: hypothetical protein VF278_21295 [Pirellulales bacterium]
MALSLPATTLLLANIAGSLASSSGLGWWNAHIVEHGWPSTWLVRQPADGSTENLWALSENVCYLDWFAAAANVIVCLALLASFAAAIEWRRRRRHRVWQFTIGDLLGVILILCFPLKVVSERRQALADVRAAAHGADLGDIATWELSLPHWLRELWPEAEFAVTPLVWLGLLRPDEMSVDFPDRQSEAALVAALINAGPDGVTVRVRRPSTGGQKEQPPFDPKALRSLLSLRQLTLERVNDDAMACLESLPEVRKLKFDVNCGPLSRSGAAHLRQLRKLRWLDVSRECLSDAGIEAVASLGTLDVLSLAGASDGDLARLSNLKRLRCLELLDAKVTDDGLASLAELPRLERLRLSGIYVTGAGFARLSQLSRLWQLDLHGCGLENDGLAGLENLRALCSLNIANTPVTGALAHLGKLRSLRRLNLCGTEINDLSLSGLPSLPRLEELILSNTRITGKGLGPLNRLPALRELDLGGTRVASLAAIDLNQLPRLTLVSICECNSWTTFNERHKFATARPSLSFSRYTGHIHGNLDFELQLPTARDRAPDDVPPIRVWLGGRTFGDRELIALRGIAAIESVQMEATRLTDAALPILTELARLRQLDLARSPITDAGVATLNKLSRLRHLDLSYTDVTPLGVARLAPLPALETVVLDPSQFTVEAIENVRRLPALARLEIARERAPWGKQYRGASDFDEFLRQLREDLPGVEVTTKAYTGAHACIEF